MKTETEDLDINHPGPLTAADIPAWVRRQVLGHSQRETAPDQLEDGYWDQLQRDIVNRYNGRTPDGTEQDFVISEAQTQIQMLRQGVSHEFGSSLREDNTLADLLNSNEVASAKVEVYTGAEAIESYRKKMEGLTPEQVEFMTNLGCGPDDVVTVTHVADSGQRILDVQHGNTTTSIKP